MNRIFSKFFGVKALLGKEVALGELPGAGPLYGSYLSIAWPAALEGLFIMLISSVDLAMVSSLGANEVAAVGIFAQPKMVMLVFCRSLGVAVTAMVARRKGEGNVDGMNRCLKQGLVLTFFFYIVICALALMFMDPILIFSGAKPEYMEEAVIYSQMIVGNIFFTALATIINSAQTGNGNTKVLFYANVWGNLVNMVLNYLLIYGSFGFPKLGIAGAGIATFAGGVATFVFTAIPLCRRNQEFSLLSKSSWKFDKATLAVFLKVGGSALAEQAFERVGMFLYTKMVADLGTIEFATHHICMTLTDIFYSLVLGLGKASSSLVGQKLGEKRRDLAFVYGKVGQRIGIVTASGAALLFWLGRYGLFDLFSNDTAVIALGGQIMIWQVISCWSECLGNHYVGVLRGAGDTTYVAAYSLFIIAVFRPIITWLMIFPLGWGIYGAWIAMFVDQTLRMLFASGRFRGKKWMLVKI